VRELKGFKKIELAPGESRTVAFTLSRLDLAFRNVDDRLSAEPGLFDLWIAPSSAAGDAATFELLGPLG